MELILDIEIKEMERNAIGTAQRVATKAVEGVSVSACLDELSVSRDKPDRIKKMKKKLMQRDLDIVFRQTGRVKQ